MIHSAIKRGTVPDNRALLTRDSLTAVEEIIITLRKHKTISAMLKTNRVRTHHSTLVNTTTS